MTSCRPHESKLERSLQIPRGGIFRQRWDTVLPLPHQHIRAGTRHAFRSGPTNEWPALDRSLRFLSAMFLPWLHPQVTPASASSASDAGFHAFRDNCPPGGPRSRRCLDIGGEARNVRGTHSWKISVPPCKGRDSVQTFSLRPAFEEWAYAERGRTI